MTDHAVLIPTSEGPVGGVVSEPAGQVRAGMVLLPGYGRPARSGTNAFWTRTARGLAEEGIVSLRIDYSQEGETYPLVASREGIAHKLSLDLSLVGQAATWFSAKLHGLCLFMSGVCGGGRLTIELAALEPELIAGAFPIVPELSAVSRPHELGDPPPNDLDALDPWMVERLRDILRHAPCWILVGEHDSGYSTDLPELLGPTPHPLELEVVPGLALHFLDHRDIHEQARRRLAARVVRAISELETEGPGSGDPYRVMPSIDMEDLAGDRPRPIGKQEAGAEGDG